MFFVASFVQDFVSAPQNGIALLMEVLKQVQLAQNDCSVDIRLGGKQQQQCLARTVADEYEALLGIRYVKCRSIGEKPLYSSIGETPFYSQIGEQPFYRPIARFSNIGGQIVSFSPIGEQPFFVQSLGFPISAVKLLVSVQSVNSLFSSNR